ncbi:MAG: hypothetical protein OHK0019_21860 [Saprospiraceae bacterium]
MLRPLLLVSLLTWLQISLAQNAFLDLYHPFHKSLKELRTDSLFIRTLDPYAGTAERAISYKYPDDKSLPPDWQEIRSESNTLRLWRVNQRAFWEGQFKTVETETLDSLSKRVTKSKVFMAENASGRLDSVWYEIWDSTEWQPVQKTLFAYKNGQFLEHRTEMHWDAASEDWVAELNMVIKYDSKNRVTQREYETYSDTGSSMQNLYTYSYRPDENQPESVVWRSNIEGKLTPIDSTVAWYDGDGLQDSSLTFFWNLISGNWHKTGRQVLKDENQKIIGQGETFHPDGQEKWQANEETIYLPGEQIFTDEPKEELVRVFDPATGEWKDKKKKVITYEPLDSTYIYGSIQISELNDSFQIWEEVFFAEAWFSIEQQKTELDSLKERGEQFTFSYFCGLPNPYVRNMTLTFPQSDVTGNYELKIISEEGRIVYRQRYDDSGTGFVDAPLQPGFYMVTVSKGNTPLCTQKLIVH